jgi:hypothetical protein
MVLLVAELPEGQLKSEVRRQYTASLLDGVYVNKGEFGPVLKPLTFHWYNGVVPPLIVVAVKVTGVPGHILLAEATIDIFTGLSGITVTIYAVVYPAQFPNAGVI